MFSAHEMGLLDSQIEQLDQKIGVLQAEMDDLIIRRHRLRAQRAAALNKESAVARLPNEILLAIFETAHHLPAVDSLDRDALLPFEMIISQVDTRFRQLVLSAPSLWSIIVINPRITQMDFIDMYLTRSQSSPLDLRFDLPDMSDEETEEYDTETLYEELLEHADRLERLFIMAATTRIAVPLLEELRDIAVPQLAHFSLFIRDQAGEYSLHTSPYEPQIFLAGSPNLTVVRLGGAAVHCYWPDFSKLHVLQLYESIDGIRLSYRLFHEMITAAPHLRKLSLFQGVVDWPGRTPRRLPLTNLHTLRLHGPNRWLSEILLLVDAPDLDSIIFSNIRTTEVEHYLQDPNVSRGIQQFPRLRALTVRALNFIDQEHLALARVFPSASYYELHNAFLGSAARTPATWTGSVPLPDLQVMVLRGSFTETEVTAMVDSRRAVGHPISVLRFDPRVVAGQSHQLSQHAIAWLKERVKLEGVRGDPLNNVEKIYEDDPY